MSLDQLDILRIYMIIGWVLSKFLTRVSHLQAHLNLAYDKVAEMRAEAGKVKNYTIQAMIYRYYRYLCCAALQYFGPAVLALLFALLLKTTGNLSWIGAPTPQSNTELNTLALSGPIRFVFDASICRAFFSFLLVVTILINFTLQLMSECLMFGMDCEARCMTSMTADEENICFLVGTNNIKNDKNQVNKLFMDPEASRLMSKTFRHPAGEVRAIAAHPTKSTILATCTADCKGLQTTNYKLFEEFFENFEDPTTNYTRKSFRYVAYTTNYIQLQKFRKFNRDYKLQFLMKKILNRNPDIFTVFDRYE
nr:hypothetical protein Y87G2A.v - Caenorhabditis elegans [Caenorhabditis elegans]